MKLASHQKFAKKNKKTLKIISVASIGVIFKLSSAVLPPDSPLQGGIKIFSDSKILGPTNMTMSVFTMK